MKVILVNIIVFMAIIGAYYTDFFGWFTYRYAFTIAIALVVIVLLSALKILGNPFSGGNDNE